MGEVNNVMCDYLGRTGCFADFWNGTVFSGRQMLGKSQLRRHDREYYKSKNKKQKVTDVRRDVQMYRKGEKDIVLGVELLDTKDYTIPVRIEDYNIQELIRQIKDFKEKNRHEEEMDSGTFLYGLKSTDRLVPVYTIGLYCGDEDAMKAYYLEHRERFRQLDDDSINVMGVLIGKRTLKMFPQEEGGLDMYKAFEDEREEGREEGILFTLSGLVKDGLLRLEEAAKRANMSEEMFCKKIQEIGG